MNHSSLPFPHQPKPSTWQYHLRLIALNILGWSIFSAISALTSLNNDLRKDLHPDYWEIFKVWADSAMAFALLSLVIYYCFTRWPRILSSGKYLLSAYAALLLLLLPLQLIFVIKDFLLDEGYALTWENMQSQVLLFDRLASFFHLTSATMVFVAIASIKVWQQSQERSRLWQQERADMLALKLELEQQHLLALRAQLEPHFVFNALNAISALVMSDNKSNALGGINGLSDLLRYALSASEKNWVSLAEELRFIEDYLNLQKLRYGERMQVSIRGVDAICLAADCPPLLLQPLIENALRHDLDCHQEASDIQIQFSHDEKLLHVQISNPYHHETSPNPGAGLGLRNTRARLDLIYGERAKLSTRSEAGRFVLELQLPLYQS
ncbi:MAG: histidine kinase [Undibacterium sp.]|nr:histidine kinase [Undibacterium sp.]